MSGLLQTHRGGMLFLLLGVTAAILMMPAAANAQAQCSAGAVVATGPVDYTTEWNYGGELTDVEQTVCLYYDGESGLDSYVETDNDSWSDWEPELDAEYGYGYYEENYEWVYGVAAEAQLYEGNNLVDDSGMQYDLPDDTGGPSISAQLTDTAQGGQTYVLYGLFAECGNGNGNFDSAGCGWGQQGVDGTTYGLSVQFQVPAGSTGPTVSSVSPSSGNVGLVVTVSGTGFGATQGQSTVRFNGPLAGILNWSDSSITAVVPSGATTGSVEVILVNGQGSNVNVIFTVNNSSCPY